MFVTEPEYHIENFGVAAGMYSNVEDLLKLDQALYTERLLDEKHKGIMYESHPELGFVAYGNWVYNYPYAEGRPKLIERRGGLLGFNCVMIRFVEDNKTIIILSNNGQFNSSSFGNTADFKEALIVAVAEI